LASHLTLRTGVVGMGSGIDVVREQAVKAVVEIASVG
jgi:hypothetical protein